MFLGSKVRLMRGADSLTAISTPSSIKVKSAWSYSPFLIHSHGVVLNFAFTLPTHCRVYISYGGGKVANASSLADHSYAV
jgi:hypothetical protein